MLLEQLHDYSDKWFNIGLKLGFTEPHLKQIRSMPLLFMSGAPTSFMTEMLSQFVQWPTDKYSSKPTLGLLCSALRSSLVGLGSQAKIVEQAMGQSTSTIRENRVLVSHNKI